MTLSEVIRENEELKRKCERMTEIIARLEHKARKFDELKMENEALKKKLDILMRAVEILRQLDGKGNNLDLDSVLNGLKVIDKNT